MAKDILVVHLPWSQWQAITARLDALEAWQEKATILLDIIVDGFQPRSSHSTVHSALDALTTPQKPA